MPRMTPPPRSGPPAPPPGLLALARGLFNSTLLDRARLAGYMGRSYPHPTTGAYQRNLYEALGYPYSVDFREYLVRYSRQDVAARIVEAPVEEAWRLPPEVYEDEDADKETAFEAAWGELEDRLGVLASLERVDLLSGIGRYGTLLLGYGDGLPLDAPVVPREGLELLYLAPYTEGSLAVDSLGKDPRDPRYLLPETYKFQGGGNLEGDLLGSRALELRNGAPVHWSRVLHVAEHCLEDDVYGRPRLRPVWNRLLDLEKVAGGGAEMFWQGAFPGMAFLADPDFEFDDTNTDSQGRTQKQQMEDEIKEWIHGLKRWMRLRGVEPKQFLPAVASPKDQVGITLDLISAQTGIPKRILVGSERGELASTQDDDAWLRRVDRRRRRHVEPRVVRPFVDRLVEHGALPEPAEGPRGYRVDWPALQDASDQEKADVGQKRAETVAKYASAPGADAVLPVEMFLEIVLGLDKDQVKQAMELREQVLEAEEEEIRRQEAEAARQATEGGGPTPGPGRPGNGRGGPPRAAGEVS